MLKDSLVFYQNMKKANLTVQPNKPYLIGVTGNFGTGKSTIGKILESKEIYVIDTDDIVMDILRSKNKTTDKIIKAFGESFVNKYSLETFYINKKLLGELVFKNPRKRKKLEVIIHPEVFKRLKKNRNSKKKYKVIAELVPLLFECNLGSNYDETWCVKCNRKTQFKRLLKKGILHKDAVLRIKTQMPQDKKSKLADYVIDNSGSISSTKKQVYARLKQMAL